MIFTFVATLMLPIQNAVFLGVLLSFVMQIYRSANKLEVIELVVLEGGRYEERPAPKQLPSHQVVVLAPKGNPFFAGAAEFEQDLPALDNAEHTVVLLRLRGIDEIGSTFMRVMKRYAAGLESCQGKLMLVGVSKPVYHQLEITGLLDQLGKENVYRATTIMGDSSLNAYQDAAAWLEQKK
jgi:SulP family sulfate permease